MIRNTIEFSALTVLVFGCLRCLSAVVCPAISQTLRIIDTAGATDLSVAVNCTGGTVDVVWVGMVKIDGTIEVGEDTTLNIFGEVGDDAVIYGAPSARIISVNTGATLYIENTTIRGGVAEANDGGDEGGGILSNGASLFLVECVVDSNEAKGSGGGVWMEKSTIVIRDSKFFNDTAADKGGAVYAEDSILTMDSVIFEVNRASDGGAIYASGNTVLTLSDVVFTDNSGDFGGAVYGSGVVEVNEGTVMNGTNIADTSGGCIYAAKDSNITIYGGTFTGCRSEGNGGFLYASGQSEVVIYNGTVHNCSATKRAGVIYASGDSEGGPGANVTVSGGTYTNNRASEHGGGFVAWGATTTIVFAGGHIINSTAEFFGGFLFLEEEASVICTNTLVEGSYAGSEGGGLYARVATNVYWACDLNVNDSPRGSAMFLNKVEIGTLVGFHIDHLSTTTSSSAVYIADSYILADGVKLTEGASSRTDIAVLMDDSSSFLAIDCVFLGWQGDSVLQNGKGILTLEGCDFSRSQAKSVVSSVSAAKIRNAVVGNEMFNAANSITALVDNVLNCSDAPCDTGVCLDGELGVYCQCYTSLVNGEVCLNGGGNVTMLASNFPGEPTVFPGIVEFSLAVNAEGGSGPVLWNISAMPSSLDILLYPSSGLLPPNSSVSVQVEAAPRTGSGGDVNVSLKVEGWVPRSEASMEVTVPYTFCNPYEYLDQFATEDTMECIQCASIVGAEGVDCSTAGVTITQLPLKIGYWRATTTSTIILDCFNRDACIGGIDVDRYCASGYMGPYCAVCKPGYGRSNGMVCHHCEGGVGVFIQVLGVFFLFILVLFLAMAIVFLLGGMEAFHTLRRSLLKKAWPAEGSTNSISEVNTPALESAEFATDHTNVPYCGTTVAPNSVLAKDKGRIPSNTQLLRSNFSNERSGDVSTESQHSVLSSGHMRERDQLPQWPATGRVKALQFPLARGDVNPAHGRGERGGRRLGQGHLGAMGGHGRENTDSLMAIGCSRGGGIKEKIARMVSKVPINKIKIVIVVWQILSAFPSITNISYPASYETFLSLINVVNLNLGSIVSASCLFEGINFYHRLLFVTLLPIVLTGMLGVTYFFARRSVKHSDLPASQEELTSVFSRHVAFGLLLTFLVFSSVSTTVFETFSCDKVEDLGVRYLRADYSIVCDTTEHDLYKAYAGIMILVYPIGIPLLYFVVLWKQRNKLDPKPETSIHETTINTSEGHGQLAEPISRWGLWIEKKQNEQKVEWELKERLRMRGSDPRLASTMFLWKDFGPKMYYYEVIECGRRILLTGALIFIEPQSAAQAAIACLFAFLSLLGFELLRPHLDEGDSWLYRLGCVIVFLSNFLGLLIKVDISNDEGITQEVFGVLLVMVNIVLLLAIWGTTYFSTQQMVDETRDREEYNDMAVMMGFRRPAPASSLHLLGPSQAYTKTRELTEEQCIQRTGTTLFPALEVLDAEDMPPRNWRVGDISRAAGILNSPLGADEKEDAMVGFERDRVGLSTAFK